MSTGNKKIKYLLVDLQAIAKIIANATTTEDIKSVASREEITLNYDTGEKWRMLTDIFIKCNETSFFRMVEEFLYFLNDEQKEEIIKIFRRNGIHIEYTGESYIIIDQKDLVTTDDEVDAYEAKKRAEEQVKTDRKIVEKIRDVREHHQLYIDVVEQFCKDYKNPSKELNEAYIYLKKLLDRELKELGIFPYIPFNDLYSAENEYTPKSLDINFDDRPKSIDWDYFRPKLYNVHSQIIQILSGAKATTPTEAKVQEINSIISRLRDERAKIDKTKNKLNELNIALPIKIIGETKIKLEDSQNKNSFETKSLKKIRLGYQGIEFDDDKATIIIGKQNVALPAYKNEHYLCRAMYEYGVNEVVDWSLIYQKMTGYYEASYGKPQNSRENWRIVYDAMNALNKRVKEAVNTNDDLFTWQEKTIKRNY
jgi:hypothetical protein